MALVAGLHLLGVLHLGQLHLVEHSNLILVVIGTHHHGVAVGHLALEVLWIAT